VDLQISGDGRHYAWIEGRGKVGGETGQRVVVDGEPAHEEVDFLQLSWSGVPAYVVREDAGQRMVVGDQPAPSTTKSAACSYGAREGEQMVWKIARRE
jgi:hypothetical protein